MRRPIRFDDSIPQLIASLKAAYSGDLAAADPIVIRDFEGRLGVILEIPTADLDHLNSAVAESLGPYARPEAAIRGRDAAGASRIVEEAQTAPVLKIDGVNLRLLDRRIVGVDWMAPPVIEPGAIPRIAFVSIKGGVGRSTALSIAATHLAQAGLRVLTVDLDLEAPGLGATLLKPEELPTYGVVDWLVENGLSGTDGTFRADCIGRSSLLDGISVVPAFGSQTLAHPADALAKIARASLEDMRDGVKIPVRVQLLEMIENFEATGDYDVVLIDGRAGLHETTATPVLGLGAKVLLFGINEPQTFQGYAFLLAHIRDRIPDGADWEEKAWFVQAKADPGDAEVAKERFNALWNIKEGPLTKPERLGPDDLELVWADNDAPAPLPKEPVPVLRILNDDRYRSFNPVANRVQLDERLVRSTFGELLDWLDEQMDLAK
ncbi:Mrp family chromosome partitioning ATPase [Angulomicrobium tetraedrale]|uniref:Mrp family chromosome partitioning ATPase n=1 Tax=Ancylobacter tetraedralis TaxID=217068 RepID=A0A839Z9U5_9HYPH|nr:AAA family ATPase [Ancylobacter tetraedralis]MBB3771497.1 Mrp family chromosome partitioning ATPase [Ancylobacter tetraedralis]